MKRCMTKPTPIAKLKRPLFMTQMMRMTGPGTSKWKISRKGGEQYHQ